VVTADPTDSSATPGLTAPPPAIAGQQDRKLAENLLDALEDVVWSIAADDFRLLYLGKAAERIYGYPVRVFFDDPGLWRRAVHPDDRRKISAGAPMAAESEEWEAEYRIVRSDGRVLWLRDRAHAVRDGTGRIVRIDGTIADISRQKQREAHILRLNRICTVLSGVNTAAMRIHDRETLFGEVCRIAVERGGFDLAWIGLAGPDRRTIRSAAHAGRDPRWLSALPPPGAPCSDDLPFSICLRTGKPFFSDDLETDPRLGDCRGTALSGNWRALASLPLKTENRVKGCLALCAREAGIFDPEVTRMLLELASDIAFALDHIEKEARLNYLALYDNLTGLASRTLFLDRLSQLIHRKNGKPFAVVVFDVDRFKHINETLTYQAGDHLLQELAARLLKLAPETNLARPSGDDFALVLADTGAENEIACFIHDTLLPAMTRPILYEGQELRIALKIGVACYPADGTDPATLLGNAELAHRGSQNSNEPLLFFGEEMNQGAGEFLRVESRLRRASEHHEFVAYYQPKIDLRDGRMYGVEALLRWRDPEQGLVLPGKFISVLEETGLILDVGRWMMEEAGCQYLRWTEQDPSPPCIAVNISPLQLGQRSFVADVETAIETCRDHKGYLELEITESAIMHDVEDNVRKLQAIREMGVEITIDDFGTGYSSLSYLTRLPLTRLKIDRSFIVNMTESADSLSIVSSIISLAHTLNLKVAAEGVETPEQLKFLKLLRCDEIQGYLFSPPVKAEEALRLKSHRW
jgi:diguanylate cyclase (GGDEF)-like protein/PAS domain S-box-containing protein